MIPLKELTLQHVAESLKAYNENEEAIANEESKSFTNFKLLMKRKSLLATYEYWKLIAKREEEETTSESEPQNPSHGKRILKVGDKVYHKDYPRWHSLSHYYNYVSATVERVTKTQAILSNGVKLVNEPENNSFRDAEPEYVYCVFGERYTRFLLETPDSVSEGNIQKERAKIYNWFKSKTFTEDEQKAIYELFNQPNEN